MTLTRQLLRIKKEINIYFITLMNMVFIVANNNINNQ